MTPRYLKPGEMLAIAANHLNQDTKGFFWMFGPSSPPSERRGDTTIVHVRGPLEHHADSYGAESYEGITKKFADAYSGADAARAHEREHRYDADFEPMEATAPKRIILSIDSPGGVVSGLNECVAGIQRMRDANPGVELCAYVNEMACSAAYALACACDEIVCPPSAILGSIGVISTMVSAVEADKKQGLDVRLVASGSKKTFGNPHTPISDGALEAETAKVDKLATEFFRLVSKARGLTMAKVESFQAGVYLGKDAKRVGLANDVKSFDEYVTPAETRIKETMSIKSLLRQLSAESDPKKVEALSAQLYGVASAAAKKPFSKSDKKDDEDDDDEDDEEAATDTAAPADESEGKTDAKVPTGATTPDEDTAATMALVQQLTGKSGADARGALMGMKMLLDKTATDVASLKKASAAKEKSDLIASVTGKFITPTEAADLATKPLAEVRSLVEFVTQRGFMVHTDENTLVKPKGSAPGTAADLPKETLEMIEDSLHGAPPDKIEGYRAELIKAHLKTQNDLHATSMNGAGRY